MRVTRLIGLGVTTVALLAVLVAVAPVIRGQAKLKQQDTQAAKNLAMALRPDVQMFQTGPEIGVTIRESDKGDGAVVDEVRSDSPASKAGVKVGDTIVEFDGERVRSVRQLTRLVQETAPGRSVKMAVMRDGKRADLSVVPEDRTADVWSGRLFEGDKLQSWEQSLRGLQEQGKTFQYRMPESGRMEVFPREGPMALFDLSRQPSGRLGVTVQELTPQLASYFGAKDGVLVTAITDGSAAAKAGLKAGDVITAVNDRAVTNSNELVTVLREARDGTDVAIAIVRDRKPMTLKATLGTPAPPRRVIRRTVII